MSHRRKAVLLTGCLLTLLAFVAAFAYAQQPAAAPKQASSLYSAEIIPLTPAECGRCHSSIYYQLRNEGGKHQLECTKCHAKFHAYNPIKQNWKEIMPKCQSCHGLFHGDKVTACGECHSEPHAPKKQIAASGELAKMCNDCHGKVGQELQQNLSKHTKVQCASCHHDRHGYIPSCMECHKPHTPNQTVKDCLACHPVHSPLKIAYPKTTGNDVCGGCHSAVYDKLTKSASKHSQVSCAACHTKHRYIPTCAECHGKPHGEVVLKKFPDCLACHVDVHDLPTKTSRK
ncbi:MAG: cytochrome C [Nitrospira sp.]|nr:cytochrome C [Nitrospira sp.]